MGPQYNEKQLLMIYLPFDFFLLRYKRQHKSIR